MLLGVTMTRKFTVILEQEGSVCTARCLELDIVSQGKSIGNALDNAREAIAICLENNPKSKTKQINVALVEVP